MAKHNVNTTRTMRSGEPEQVEQDQSEMQSGPRDLSADELATLPQSELIEMLLGEQAKGKQLQYEMDRARVAGEAAAMLTSNMIEVYAGHKTVEVEVEKGVFKDMEREYWRYTLDLPASAGQGITINSMPAYHGQVITVDTDTLRTVKEMVYRAWYHEQSIFGKANDNAFRQGYMNTGRNTSPILGGGKPAAWATARQ